MMRPIMCLLCLILSVGLTQEVGARYLIITHDNFYDALQPFAYWKHKKGMRTKVAKLSEIGSTALAIRNYILNAYNNWPIRPEFVLFVGAPNYVPFPTVSGVYSDNYYTNMDGDIYNEILSGRLTVHTLTEAQNVVNKMFLYERTPEMQDSLWFRKACLIVNIDNDAYDDSIYWSDAHHAAGLIVNNGYVNIDTLSDFYGHNATSIINAVNSGRSIVMYRGSGTNNWYAPFDVNPDLTVNGTKLPIVLSITCRTIGTSSTPAIAEKWFLTGTPTQPRGASGYFATTTSVTNQAYLRSAVSKGFMDAVFVDKKRTFGEACEGGRLRVYSMYPTLGGDEEYYGFTTIGDPEMNLWTATPKPMTVLHDTLLRVGNDTLTVGVIFQGVPIESAFVCVLFDTLIYQSGYTNINGNIIFLLNLANPGNLELTVTGRNFHPYEATIPVMSNDIYLSYQHNTIEDSLGNNDGVVNPGETILLRAIIKNLGSATAYGVSAILRSTDTLIFITDSTSFYGNMIGGDSSQGFNPFVFTVSPSTPAHAIPFDIIIKDAYGNSWSDNFSVMTTGGGGGGGGEIGPDPYGYYIYDNTDTLTGNAPVYSWFEIAPPAGGPGLIISQITNEDADTVTLPLPFNFKFYGINYNSIGACSNGFLELGNATYPYAYNDMIPMPGKAKRLVSPFWDDLNPGLQQMGHGDIYQFYDAPRHRWIVEFYQVALGYQPHPWETFQIVLRNPIYYPTPTGDGEILFFYRNIANATSNTVGIEDHTETQGIQYVYNNYYDPNAAILTNGRALLITTKPPIGGQPHHPWLYLLTHTIDDSLGGNNNGIPEPGETIQITLTIKNDGDTIVTSVNGILRSNSSNVTIIDSVANFGDIVIGGINDNSFDPYDVQISSNPSDTVVGFVVYFMGNGGNYETYSYFTIFIHNPVFIEENSSMVKINKFEIIPTIAHSRLNIYLAIANSKLPANLAIYDVTGRLVRLWDYKTIRPSGKFSWNGCDDFGRQLPTGIYFVKLETPEFKEVKKVVFIQ